MKKKIVIVDDHVLIGKALNSIISNFNNFEVIYECENGQKLQQKFDDLANIPDIVLLDISMPIMDGFETSKWLKATHPKVLIMALSMQDDELSLIKMIRNGANGYLLKNAHPTELDRALNIMITEGQYYPDWASKKAIENTNITDKTDNLYFTKREIEFLALSVTELTFREIGDKMFCSPRTIEGYRNTLCEKLELKTRVGLAVFALKNGFA